MTTFHGGLADRQVLFIRRHPLFLRVAVAGQSFDCLDRLDDKPDDGEVLHAYRRERQGGWVHIRPGGLFPLADYRYLDTQPSQEVMRDTASWQAWASEEFRKERAT